MAEHKKIGIMGGTFNPIHFGHLLLAETAFHQFNLDEILIMPTKNPYYKKISNSVTEEDRVAMVELAIEDNVHFQLSKEELNREGTTYTVETLSHLTVKHPGYEYYFIMGADSLFAFESWHEPQKICQNCILAVAVRDHVEEETFREQIHYLAEKYHARILVLATPNIDISSHQIRMWIKTKGMSLRYYVPDDVISYIEEKNLYSECEK